MDKGLEGGTPAQGDARQGAEKSRGEALTREERLAMQLRENLKKRKALARVKRQADGGR